MVINKGEDTRKVRAKQGPEVVTAKPMKIGASTPYEFTASNLTPYGGLLPVATMLEKLQFQQLIEERVTIKRLTKSMPGVGFVLGMVLALYVGFSRLNHLQFLEQEPMLTGILGVLRLPPQCVRTGPGWTPGCSRLAALSPLPFCWRSFSSVSTSWKASELSRRPSAWRPAWSCW